LTCVVEVEGSWCVWSWRWSERVWC